MDFKIILLISFILTVSSENDSRHEDSEEEEIELADWSSKESKENIQQNNFKDSSNTVKKTEDKQIDIEIFVEDKNNKNENQSKSEDAVQNNENKDQINAKNTGNEQSNEKINQSTPIDKTIEDNKLTDPGDGQTRESKEQNNAINSSNEQNNASKEQDKDINMSNEKSNVKKELELATDKPNHQNIDKKLQMKPMNMSNEGNNVNKYQVQLKDMPNNQNVERKDPINMSNEQSNTNKEQEQSTAKPNKQNIENKDLQKPTNMSNEQNNVIKDREQPTVPDNHDIESKDQVKSMNMSNEQNNINKEQEQSTAKPNKQNIENNDQLKPMNMSNEENNVSKDQAQPMDMKDNQNIESEDQVKPMNMSYKHNNTIKEQDQSTAKPNKQSMNMSNGQNNVNKEQGQSIDTPNNQNIENRDQLKTMNMTNEQNDVNKEQKQPTDKSDNRKNENKEQKNLNKSEEQKNKNNGKLESEDQNINEPVGSQNFEKENLTDKQINVTESFSDLNKDNFRKLNFNNETDKQKSEDLENQESNISAKQVGKDGEKYNKLPVNRQNNTILKQGNPNIVVIMADDMGWNDFSYHGSDQILTPNIDVIAYQGIVLQQHYTDAYGTPSRSAFFTGKYPFRLGTQSESILASEDRGLPINERLLPSYLKDLGYTTHLVGKWGLGKSREHFLPTNRGFDTFFGFLDSAVDYYTYDHVESWNTTEYFGLDLYNNRIPAENIKGHLTDVLTDHAVQLIREHPVSYPMYLQVSHAAPHAGGGLVNLQPPVDEVAKNDHIAHTARRLYAGMVTSLDKSVGQIIAALAEKQILSNTIIVFLTDNGAATVGPTQNYGSNLPLRGIKGTPWEGGVRSSAIVWHHNVESNIWDGLFHITDWLPTLLSAAGRNITTALDGVNQWQSVNNNGFSKRNDVVIAVDDLNGWAAMIEGDHKIIIGNAIINEFSGYNGKDLKGFKYDPPFYSDVLLDCEAVSVMRDLGREVDLRSAFLKRNDTLLIEIEKVNLRELCVPTKAKGCLFNIKEDPLEAHDVWTTSPDIVKRLTLRLRTMWAELQPRAKPVRDDRCDPARSNYVWTQWLDNDEPHPASLLFPAAFPLQASKDELQYLVDINMNSFRDKIYDYIQGMGDSFIKSVSALFNF